MRTWAGELETSVQAITRLPSGFCANLGNPLARAEEEDVSVTASLIAPSDLTRRIRTSAASPPVLSNPVSYTHLTLPTKA